MVSLNDDGSFCRKCVAANTLSFEKHSTVHFILYMHFFSSTDKQAPLYSTHALQYLAVIRGKPLIFFVKMPDLKHDTC